MTFTDTGRQSGVTGWKGINSSPLMIEYEKKQESRVQLLSLLAHTKASNIKAALLTQCVLNMGLKLFCDGFDILTLSNHHPQKRDLLVVFNCFAV